MNRALLACCAALLLIPAGCRPASQRDIRELKDQIGELAQKVDAIDQKLGGGRQVAQAPVRQVEDFEAVHRIDIEGSPVRGPQDAPVTLVEYSDFQCPFCARADPLLKQVAEKYPRQLRIVFKHFPLSFHPAARPVALASLAAQEQGKFWEFHDVVFKHNETLDGSQESVERYAKEAGLDLARFRKDLKEKRAQYDARIEKDLQQGNDVDVRGTPTLYLNGKKLDPRQRSLEAMSAAIESLLGS
jgi:protein-disulfide isomerase